MISERFDAVIARRDSFRLGILGGTFDPVHLGHLHIAQCASEQYALDGVLFITTGVPIRKVGSGFSDAEHRHAMVKAAIAGNECFDASRIELDRPGETYTIDTLRALRRFYGEGVELFFIAGFDAAADMGTWNGADEIAQLVTVLCAERTGAGFSDVGQGTADADAPFRLSADVLPLQTRIGGFTVQPIHAVNIDISSQALRTLLKSGQSARYLIPDATLGYIEEHGLYR